MYDEFHEEDFLQVGRYLGMHMKVISLKKIWNLLFQHPYFERRLIISLIKMGRGKSDWLPCIGHLLLLLTLIVFLYHRTLAPGLTWAFDGADGADLLSAVYTRGIPHPPGYPTYLLLMGWFANLPWGSLALAGNYFSLVCMTVSNGLVFLWAWNMTNRPELAFLAGFAFGTLPLVWSQALITEVYALQTLLCTLFLISLFGRTPDWVRGIILGLAIGNHLTAVFLVPLLVMVQNDMVLHPRWLLPRFLKKIVNLIPWLLLGASVYLLLPLRASSHPLINWGNPVTLPNFIWLVTGTMYHSRVGFWSWEYLWESIQIAVSFLIDQFTYLGMTLLLGFWTYATESAAFLLVSSWVVAIYTVFTIVYFSPDAYVYLILPCMMLILWGTLGVEKFLELPGLSSGLRRLVLGLLFLSILYRVSKIYPEIDLSKDQNVYALTTSLINSIPKNAIVWTTGDELYFSLGYMQWVLGERPDIIILSSELLHHDWYREYLPVHFSGLGIPRMSGIQDWLEINPGRPICVLDQIIDSEAVCMWGNDKP